MIYELAKAGVLVRVGRDQFLLEESVRRYCEHIRRTALSNDGAALRDHLAASNPSANGRSTATAD
jgi:hypothetical protein